MKSPPPVAPGQLELVRPPAPGRLELVRSFLNTQSLETGRDAIATPEALAAWLVEAGIVPKKARLAPSDAEHADVLAVRESLRRMTSRNNNVPCECDAEILAAVSERSRYALVFDPATNSAALQPTAPGVAGALGRILAAVHVGMLDGTWGRLKQCADATCAWTFYDRSKNGCSRWCSAETCGNRSKVKAYRERRASASAPS